MGLGEGADAAEEVWQPRASVYIGEKEWDEGEGYDERDEILAEERMNVCPAIQQCTMLLAEHPDIMLHNLQVPAVKNGEAVPK